MATTQEEWEQWFQGVWEYREEQLYRGLFGDIGQKIYTVPKDLFEGLGVKELDPRWLVHGVLECPSSLQRPTWVYVTSGLSNPWGVDPAEVNPQEPSGLGMELMLITPVRAPWAVNVLHWLMAVQLLVADDVMEGGLVGYMDRVPLGVSVDPKNPSELNGLIITEPEGLPAEFALPSGKVALVQCVGVTQREMEFARTQGTPTLIDVLKHHEIYPLTDARRASAL